MCATSTCGSPNSAGVVDLPRGVRGKCRFEGSSAHGPLEIPQFHQHHPAPLRGMAGCVSCVTQSSPASSSLLSASNFLDALPFAKRGAFLMVGEKEK